MKRLIAIILLLCSLFGLAVADEYYIICNPKSYVNVRMSPKKASDGTGRLEFGDLVTTDGRRRNGYLHCVGLSNEWGEGWVYKGYLVPDKPVRETCMATVVSNGRVACRRYVNGKRKAWAYNGDEVTVYGYSDEWAVTSKGFIQLRYLEVWYGN